MSLVSFASRLTAFGLLAFCLAPVGAYATPYHHHRHHVASLRQYEATAVPVMRQARPVYGAWHDRLLFPSCDHSYPMTEQAACGTATGGPSGGIN